jgi:hypothetical protein
MQLDKILSEQEEVEIRKLLANDVLMPALKKVLLYSIYHSGTLKPGEDPDFLRNFVYSLLIEPRTGQEYKVTNEELGEKLRARIEGIIMLDDGFKHLEKFRQDIKADAEEKNPAR